MKDEPVALVCTRCGETRDLGGATAHDLREEGVRVRRVHGRLAVPGLCPSCNPEHEG